MCGRWLIVLIALMAAAPPAVAQTCGKEHHPDAGSFDPEGVVDEALWQSFMSRGGFAGGVEGPGPLSRDVVSSSAPSLRFTVSLDVVEVDEYVGGSLELRVVLRLRARETAGATEVLHNFTHLSIAGRSGGGLALVADANETSLSVFWRWAWVSCSEQFPLSYYVFHASVEDSEVVEDNALVYFEVARPRRPPPVDLILLITAGIAVSVIFLLARRALKRDRTIK